MYLPAVMEPPARLEPGLQFQPAANKGPNGPSKHRRHTSEQPGKEPGQVPKVMCEPYKFYTEGGRVSVWEEEKVLEVGGGDGCTTLCVD